MSPQTPTEEKAIISRKGPSWLFWKLFFIWLPLCGVVVIAGILIRQLGTRDGRFRFSELELAKSSAFAMDAVLYISLFATILLIIFGTLEFFIGILDAQKGDKYARKAFYFTLLSFPLSLVWVGALFINDPRVWPITGHGLGHGIELWSVLIFSLFAAIDYLFGKSVKQEMKTIQDRTPSDDNQDQHKIELAKKSLDLKYQFVRGSLLFIDIPVLFGLVMVFFLSWYFINTPELHELTQEGRRCFGGDFDEARNCFGEMINVTERQKVFQSFMHGFSTGAIVMHLAFSQLIFGILKSRDIHQRYKEGLTEDIYA